MLLLRIYTLDVNTGDLIVIGNSIVKIFSQDDSEEVLKYVLWYFFFFFLVQNFSFHVN